MLEVYLLALLARRDNYIQVRPALTGDGLDKATKELLEEYGRYYSEFPEHDVIEPRIFGPRVLRTKYKHASDEEKSAVVAMLRTVFSTKVDDCSRDTIMKEMNERAASAEAAALLLRYDEGDLDVPLVAALQEVADRRAASAGALSKPTKVADDMDSILAAEMDDKGMQFRLSCLRKTCRGLRAGDFIILAARPDQGKTTLTTSEVTYLAKQCTANGFDRVIWLNNEGPGARIWPRLYSAAIGCSTDDLITKVKAGTLYDEYSAAVGARDRIEVHDVHGWTWGTLQAFILRRPRCVFVFDMLDNIGMPGAERRDLQLERLYQGARDLMAMTDSVGIATSQVSGDGDGLQYPSMAMLKDSKTGKQGASDLIVIMGSVPNDPGLVNQRWISTPKNKLKRNGAPSNVQAQVQIDTARSRINDIPVGA